MNCDDIISRQNEPSMLKIQYAARCCYNMAEKQNYFVWTFCLISAFSIFLPDGLPWYISLSVPFFADIIAWVFMFLVNRNVGKGAELRKYFDAYILDIGIDKFSVSGKRRLSGIAEEAYLKNIEVAELQMKNTGNDNPPGVHDWYMFSEHYEGLEAKFECQRQNAWWDNKLFPKRYGAMVIMFTVTVIIYFWFARRIGLVKSLLCSAGILVKIAERVKEYYEYCTLSSKIDGSLQTLEVHLTLEGVEQLQSLIDNRRSVNVLGINIIHKMFANKFTKLYDNISKINQHDE
jgi:hypothetical protein